LQHFLGGDEAEGEMRHRTVMDFVNRRMMSQTISSRGDDALT
jgi:hypothetical protein